MLKNIIDLQPTIQKELLFMKLIIMLTLTLTILGTAVSFAFADLQNIRIRYGYQDQNGNLIIRFNFGFNEKLYEIFPSLDFNFYGNQEELYQLASGSKSAHSGKYRFSFFDPSQENQRGIFFGGMDAEDIINDQYLLVCGDKQLEFEPISEDLKKDLEQKIQNGEIPLVFLPIEIRQSEYLFRTKKGDFIIYVDSSKFYSYESFRFFIGKLGEMRELKVTNVERFRGGGTTYIYLEDGSVLFAPVLQDDEILPDLQDETLPEEPQTEFEEILAVLRGEILTPTWTDSSG